MGGDWVQRRINHSSGGVPSLATFSIEGFDPLITKTFIAHEADTLEMYRDALSEVFLQIARLSSSQDVQKHLIGGVSQTGFTRLT